MTLVILYQVGSTTTLPIIHYQKQVDTLSELTTLSIGYSYNILYHLKMKVL